MSSVQYERVVEEVSDDEHEVRTQHPELLQLQYPKGLRWSKSIGVAQLILGFLIAFLGLMEVLIIPITENQTASAQFNHATCFGAGLWGGLVMVLTGATSVRVSISHRKTTMFRFYNLTILTLIVFAGLTVFELVAYCLGWPTQDGHTVSSRQQDVHMFVIIMMVLGLVFAVSVLIQHSRTICCDLELWRPWLWCLCCVCLIQRQRFLEPALITILTYDPSRQQQQRQPARTLDVPSPCVAVQ